MMSRQEAIRIMQLNKGRMDGSVQAALAVLLPELDAPQRTVLEWRTCKAGDQLGLRALIRYPAYAEIGYFAKADGDWVPMDEIEHQQKKSCFNCARVVKCDPGAEAAASGKTRICANWTSEMEGHMLKKSMPTWKRSRNNYEVPCICSVFEKTGRRNTALYMGGYFIDLDDLFNKLPKEE